jgi:hypothetical protein
VQHIQQRNAFLRDLSQKVAVTATNDPNHGLGGPGSPTRLQTSPSSCQEVSNVTDSAELHPAADDVSGHRTVSDISGKS